MWHFPERKALRPYYKHDYKAICDKLQRLGSDEAELEQQRQVLRYMFQTDLFWLLYFGFNRRDINAYDSPFLVKACQEVEEGPQTDTLDLWSRGHYKSTVITQGRTVQEILNDPEITVGIFSHTRPIAKDFLRPIKLVLESNELLKFCFPEILWERPKRDAPVWSMDGGLCVQRKSESNTVTLEAWGLVDGMPTGKHFALRVYDDVITEDTATTPTQLQKAEDAFRLSDNLGAKGGRQRIVGTSYSHGDFYARIREEAELGLYPWHVRIKPWYDAAHYEKTGIKEPVLLSYDEVKEKQRKQGPRIFAAQMELDPSNEEMREFRKSWIRWYETLPDMLNTYLLVDPANEKKPDSDYTALALVGIDVLENRYLLDLVRDKLDLFERWQALAKMVRKWPRTKAFYEKYGMQADISYIKQRQREDGVYFPLHEISGKVSKLDRIRRLQPVFCSERFYFPVSGIVYLGQDLVVTLIKEEYETFPFSKSFDMLDAISRIEDPQVAATGPIMQHEGQSITRMREDRLQRMDAAEDI